jgi:hypothetical protein
MRWVWVKAYCEHLEQGLHLPKHSKLWSGGVSLIDLVAGDEKVLQCRMTL